MPESSNSNEDLGHFCYLFCKLLRKKPGDNWLWSFFALSILLYLILQESYSRHWAKKENKKQTQQGQKIGREAQLLAPNSQWRVIKGKHRQEHGFTRHGEWSHLGGEQGRLNSPWWRSTNPLGKKPQLAMASRGTRDASWCRWESL